MKKVYENCYVETVDGIATIGFNDNEKSKDSLKDVIFFEFEVKKGNQINKGDKLLTIEVMKGTLSLDSEISGEVVELNTAVEDDPEILLKKPDTWLLKIKV